MVASHKAQAQLLQYLRVLPIVNDEGSNFFY
jgi:hypothetical protein